MLCAFQITETVTVCRPGVFECKPQGPPEEVGLPDVACARVPPRRATHRSGRKAGHPADRAVRPGLVTATRACCPARPRSLGSLTACGEMVVSVWVISTGSSGAVLFVSGSMILSASIRERGRSSGVSAMTEAVLSGGDTSSCAGISRAGSPALPQTPVAAAFRVVQVIAGRVPRVSRVVGTAYCGRTERPDLDRQRDQTAFCRRRTDRRLFLDRPRARPNTERDIGSGVTRIRIAEYTGDPCRSSVLASHAGMVLK